MDILGGLKVSGGGISGDTFYGNAENLTGVTNNYLIEFGRNGKVNIGSYLRTNTHVVMNRKKGSIITKDCILQKITARGDSVSGNTFSFRVTRYDSGGNDIIDEDFNVNGDGLVYDVPFGNLNNFSEDDYITGQIINPISGNTTSVKNVMVTMKFKLNT